MSLFRSRPQPRHGAPAEPAMVVRLLPPPGDLSETQDWTVRTYTLASTPGTALPVFPEDAHEPPSPQAAALVFTTLAYLTAEVAYLEQRGQLARVDEAARARDAGERLKPGGTVAVITRKASAMLRHCPASALPPPPARIRWLERGDG